VSGTNPVSVWNPDLNGSKIIKGKKLGAKQLFEIIIKSRRTSGPFICPRRLKAQDLRKVPVGVVCIPVFGMHVVCASARV